MWIAGVKEPQIVGEHQECPKSNLHLLYRQQDLSTGITAVGANRMASFLKIQQLEANRSCPPECNQATTCTVFRVNRFPVKSDM